MSNMALRSEHTITLDQAEHSAISRDGPRPITYQRDIKGLLPLTT